MGAASRAENVIYLNDWAQRSCPTVDAEGCNDICYRNSEKECPQVNKSWKSPEAINGVLIAVVTLVVAVITIVANYYVQVNGTEKTAAAIMEAARFNAAAQKEENHRIENNPCKHLADHLDNAKDLKSADVKTKRLNELRLDSRYATCPQREDIQSQLDDVTHEQVKSRDGQKLPPSAPKVQQSDNPVIYNSKSVDGRAASQQGDSGKLLTVSMHDDPLRLFPARAHTTTYFVRSGSIELRIAGEP